jgi:hypothetical protein
MRDNSSTTNIDKQITYAITACKITIVTCVLLLIVTLMLKLYLECNYYQVSFSHGDSYYVKDNKWEELPDGDIKFNTWFWNRTVTGKDYRIIEPLIKKYYE